MNTHPQAVRIAGILDTMSASRSDIVLRLPDGTKVPLRLGAHDAAMLPQLSGHRVVVSGRAHDRPSGQLLLVDVESFTAMDVADALFERVPPVPTRLLLPQVQEGETSGVAAFFGTWPGDESDPDLLEALAAIE